MCTYCRFWDAEKAMLLYPGDANENVFKSYKTDDYLKHWDEDLEQHNHNRIDHQCKLGFVSVLVDDELDEKLGKKVLKLINAI
jgi:5-methylcytosine-specific restriction enzyme subunit McrC